MKQTSLFGTKRLTYSQADSPVSHIQPQGNDLGKRTSDISGRRCLERLEKLNHVGSLARTFTVLLVGMKGWSSKRCKLTWKMKGTKSNRIYFQLHPSTLPIEEIESGLLLKTPCAADSYSENLSKKEQKFGNSGTLAQEVQSGFIEKRGIMLPTPTASDNMGLDPTTANRKANGEKRPSGAQIGSKLIMDKRITDQMTSSNSLLNPLFVEEMMGFPENWTLLPFLNGETNPSKPTETPSSHK
jgi:hypothetical protein